jgi:hypothetical protein
MNNDTLCTFEGRRDDVLVAYLYDDIDPAERDTFEQHLPGCTHCRTELAALSDVRGGLAAWAAPDVAEGVGGKTPRSALRLVDTPPPRSAGWRAIAEAPIWMQAAAAMLVVAASLGLANISLTYNRDGLSVSTGWMRPAPVSNAASTAATAAPAQTAAAADAASASPAGSPWRADLVALEQQLRQELATPAHAATATPLSSDDEALLKRVRALIQDSERRQQRELALRVAEVARDAQVQRQADLMKIDRSLGLIQSRTGVEVMRTQQQLNSLAQRVSEQR